MRQKIAFTLLKPLWSQPLAHKINLIKKSPEVGLFFFSNFNKMHKKSDLFYVIVNPNSGSKKALKDWEKINSLLRKSIIIFDFYLTKQAGDAIVATKNAIENGYRRFIAVGGDGTLNEVINGIFTQKFCNTDEIVVGILPVGTGNDWSRNYYIPKDYKLAIKLLEKQNIIVQDVGLAEISGRKQFFINVAGLGFDALVAKKTNFQKQKGKGSKFSFLLNIFSTINNYKAISSKIILTDKTFNVDLFSMSIGICRYNGGGMLQLPKAIPDDGLFDVTIIKKISIFDLILNIKKLYDGNILKHPNVINLRTNKLSVISKYNLLLETDGETLETGSYEFSIIPKAIKLIIK